LFRSLPVAAALVALAAATDIHGQGAIEKAELVKVSMIEKISRFIEWPAALPPRFMLCVGNDHPQLAAVKTYYESGTIGERPVEVQVIKRSDGIGGCHVLFLGPRELGDLARMRASADKDHVLLVAESASAAKGGVHVAFYSDMNKLRLEVNRKALDASGLKANYRLLEVAKVVE
jgi:hypothetical protein